MAFTNLEKRYNQTVNKLYKGATTKFENGKPSTGRNDDPLVVRRVGDGYFGGASRALGRALPVTSALQDVKRLTLFTFSVRGVTFLLKQQLLQTGNTFEQTRLINPVFAIGNAVPFLHLRRHLRPLNTLLKKTDTSYSNVRKLGQLQKSTYDSFTKNATGGIKGLLKKIAGPITSTISAFTAKKNVGDDFGYDADGWKKTRPELGTKDSDYILSFVNPTVRFKYGGVLNPENETFVFSNTIRYGAIPNGAGRWDGLYKTYFYISNGSSDWSYKIFDSDYTNGSYTRPDRGGTAGGVPNDDGVSIGADVSRTALVSDVVEEYGLLALYNKEDMQAKQQLIDNQQKFIDAENAWISEITKNNEESIPFLKYFEGDVESITGDKQFEDSGMTSQNAKYIAINRTTPNKRISYIKDPSNETGSSAANILRPYRNINNDFDDAITIAIAMGNDDPIKFRAFIKDLQQSASPEYKNYQYIGRTEKFISYVTVQREISFKLGVLAFSKDELDVVWKRINYLTGLVYPYGINKGILQPNIIRLTIGNMYVNQPGYLTSLSTNFNEITESWDIDRGVPMGAQVDMKFVLIEKKSRIASSPFYGITEQMSGSVGPFEQTITTR